MTVHHSAQPTAPTAMAVTAVAAVGRPSSRLRYREIAHLTLRALYLTRRAGSSMASTARPIPRNGSLQHILDRGARRAP
jgi:hypothetical protein